VEGGATWRLDHRERRGTAELISLEFGDKKKKKEGLFSCSEGKGEKGGGKKGGLSHNFPFKESGEELLRPPGPQEEEEGKEDREKKRKKEREEEGRERRRPSHPPRGEKVVGTCNMRKK